MCVCNCLITTERAAAEEGVESVPCSSTSQVQLLTTGQRHSASALSGTAAQPSALPVVTSEEDEPDIVFVTLPGITPAEQARLCGDGESQTSTPDLPPRTEEMLEIVTSDGSLNENSNISSQRPAVALSQPTSPVMQHMPPSPSTAFSASQPASSSLPPHTPPPTHPHSTPNLHTLSQALSSQYPPESLSSPPHSQQSTSSQPTELLSAPQLASQISTSLSDPPQDQPQLSLTHGKPSPTGISPPPLPPKPGTRLQSNSDQETAAGYSYCIMLPAQLPSAALHTSTTGSSKVDMPIQPHEQLWGQPLNQETTLASEEAQRKQKLSPSFQEEPVNQSTELTQEEQSLPPPRPPKHTLSPVKSFSTSSATERHWQSHSPTTGHSKRGGESRPPLMLKDNIPPPSSLLPSRAPRHPLKGGGRITVSEGSMSLPPRHIRRYPTASTTSSSSSTAGPGSLEETGEEEVFLKYNESYHTITRHFHSERLRTD